MAGTGRAELCRVSNVSEAPALGTARGATTSRPRDRAPATGADAADRALQARTTNPCPRGRHASPGPPPPPFVARGLGALLEAARQRARRFDRGRLRCGQRLGGRARPLAIRPVRTRPRVVARNRAGRPDRGLPAEPRPPRTVIPSPPKGRGSGSGA